MYEDCELLQVQILFIIMCLLHYPDPGMDDFDSPKQPPTPLHVAVNSTAQSLTVKMLEPLTADSAISTSSCDNLNETSVSFGVPCNEIVVSSVAMQGIVVLHIHNYFDAVAPPGVADSLVISVNVSYSSNGECPISSHL